MAKVWDLVLPDPVQRSLAKAVDNTNFVSRLVNSLAQGKFKGAGRELARAGINTTVGLGGLFDVAGTGLGIQKSDEDTGQTLGFYGVDPGPFLVLPLLPPTSVRDGLGSILDKAMNPINYLIPFAGGADAVVGHVVIVDAQHQPARTLDRPAPPPADVKWRTAADPSDQAVARCRTARSAGQRKLLFRRSIAEFKRAAGSDFGLARPTPHVRLLDTDCAES